MRAGGLVVVEGLARQLGEGPVLGVDAQGGAADLLTAEGRGRVLHEHVEGALHGSALPPEHDPAAGLDLAHDDPVELPPHKLVGGDAGAGPDHAAV